MRTLALNPTLSLIGDPESDEARTGAFLRSTAVLGSAATGAVVLTGAAHLGLAHRALVPVALAPLVAVVAASRLAHPRLRATSLTALVAVLVEAATGAALTGTRAAAWAGAAHLVLGTLAFAATAVSAGASLRGGATPLGPWRDYLALTKPRIMVLLLVTAAGGMFVAAHGVPSLRALALTMLGGALASGGASALNHVMDRDVDRRMLRTSTRPVAATRVGPSAALEFGLALSAASFVLLASLVNVLAALLALAGNLVYVLVYTGWLKRSTPRNIVIGGAAGAIPPLVGWAAATGHLSIPALWLFLTVFFWTPPHFWALALLMRADYAAAGIPMLPVVRGEIETTRQILRYSLVLVAVTLAPYASGTLGLAYLVPALVLGGAFVWLALRLRADPTPSRARVLFHFSLAYLAALFLAMALAPLVG